MPGYVLGWKFQPRQRAEPGRDKARCNVSREGFSDPGAVAIAKVHIKVKVTETNRKNKPRRGVKETFVFRGTHSGKIKKQKSFHC